MARVALVCNLIRPEMLAGKPMEAVAELDSEETISAVEDALRSGGHAVVRVQADADLFSSLRAAQADIVFNIAEGISHGDGVHGGESRESIVPAVCELMDLPYTGSGVLATALCLDKPQTKRILQTLGILTPSFQVFETGAEALVPRLRFPLIAKLAREGSSMGLTSASIVDDETSLQQLVTRLINTYRQPVLVEEFIEGREFTAGVLGNKTLQVLPLVELLFDDPRGMNLFVADDPVREMARAAENPSHGTAGTMRRACPAPLNDEVNREIGDLARRAFHGLGCRDWCRIDFRMDRDDHLYLLELNPIAGIDPSYLLPRAAAAAGLSYAALINRILNEAIERYSSDI